MRFSCLENQTVVGCSSQRGRCSHCTALQGQRGQRLKHCRERWKRANIENCYGVYCHQHSSMVRVSGIFTLVVLGFPTRCREQPERSASSHQPWCLQQPPSMALQHTPAPKASLWRMAQRPDAMNFAAAAWNWLDWCIKVIQMVSVSFLFTSVWIFLLCTSDILSHFMYYDFLTLFCLPYIWKQLFPHAHQSILAFLLCALPSPLLFWAGPSVFAVSSLFSLPVLDFSPLFVFLWCFLVLSLHPSCQSERGTPLGDAHQKQLACSGGLCWLRHLRRRRRLAHCTACWNESRSSPRVLCTTHCEKSGKWRCPVTWGARANFTSTFSMSYAWFLFWGTA